MSENVEPAVRWRNRPRPPLLGLRSPNWIPGFTLFLVLLIMTATFAADAFSSRADRVFRHVSRSGDVLFAVGGGIATIAVAAIICLYILRPVQKR